MARIANLLAQQRRSKIVSVSGIEVQVREMSGLAAISMQGMLRDGPDGKPVFDFEDERKRDRFLQLVLDHSFDPQSGQPAFDSLVEVQMLPMGALMTLITAISEVSRMEEADLKA